MQKLQILCIYSQSGQVEQFAAQMAHAGNSVLPVSSLSEAVQALQIQQFDVVVFGFRPPADELVAFHGQMNEAGDLSGGQRIPLLLLAEPSRVFVSGNEKVFDDIIPADLPAGSLVDLVSRLTERWVLPDGLEAAPVLPSFESDKFREQLGSDASLLAEIIDLFLSECAHQLPSLWDSLAQGDYGQAGRLAHTLKGSLGSLQAPEGRSYAHKLEQAAKEQDGSRCQHLLSQLESALLTLEPLLIQERRAADQSPCYA